MAISNDLFEIQKTREGSGWSALRVMVKWIFVPNSMSEKENVVCLTNELLNQEEFDEAIDNIIAQLEALKKKASPIIRKISMENKK